MRQPTSVGRKLRKTVAELGCCEAMSAVVTSPFLGAGNVIGCDVCWRPMATAPRLLCPVRPGLTSILMLPPGRR